MATAKVLASTWSSKLPSNRDWLAPRQILAVSDPDLKSIYSCYYYRFKLMMVDTLAAGVAFHHAGLDLYDRQAVQAGYLQGDVSVICCTSTLAVGVNLPCHLVIIKNTVSWQEEGLKEYADLEIMQMLGRAGR